MKATLDEATETIAKAGREIYLRGWVPATSGNFSMRLDDTNLAITVSGTNKGRLGTGDVMQVNPNGQTESDKKASAEVGLHLQLYRRDTDIGAVLHTHSVNATICSQRVADVCRFEDLELLKAFDGINTHKTEFNIPVFDNTQDIDALAADVEQHMQTAGQGHAYMIRGHGLYTWGRTMTDCQRHLEALEYLLELYVLDKRTVS